MRTLTPTVLLVLLLAFFVPSVAWAGPVDTDGDGVTDDVDNCTFAPNAAQDDSDSDLCGNACDADYNQDSLVTIQDFGIFQPCFAGTNVQGICDMAPEPLDGIVTILDFGIFTQQFAQGVPGPGLSEKCDGIPL